MTKYKTNISGKAFKKGMGKKFTPDNTGGCRLHLPLEKCSLVYNFQCFPNRWVDGGKQQLLFLSLPTLELQHETVVCLPPRRQRAPFPSPLFSLAGSHSESSNVAAGYYCNDSGMVLTTWVALVAAGGEPKKVLV